MSAGSAAAVLSVTEESSIDASASRPLITKIGRAAGSLNTGPGVAACAAIQEIRLMSAAEAPLVACGDGRLVTRLHGRHFE